MLADTFPAFLGADIDDLFLQEAKRKVAKDRTVSLNGKLVLLGERHLRLAITEFVEHYHLERHHQGLDSQLITTPPTAGPPANHNSPVARRERLGGLLNFYYRRTA